MPQIPKNIVILQLITKNRNYMELHEIREKLKEMYGGENKPITDGNYD